MDNKKIGTGLGTVVIIIITVTLVAYFWKYDKLNNPNYSLETKNTLSEKAIPSSATGTGIYTNDKNGFSIKLSDGWIYRATSNGAGFQPKNKPLAIENETISISAMPRMGGTKNIPFETYVKTAASQEIQNYKSLASIEKIITRSGIVGYKTTWKVAPMTAIGVDIGSSNSVSSPIYYFDAKNSNKDTIQMSCDKDFIKVCDEMASTFELINEN